MTVTLNPGFSHRHYSWDDWKSALAQKGGVHQHDEENGVYLIWFYDGPEVNITSMYQGTVPVTELENITQERNDEIRADFEANFKPTSNGSLQPKTNNGVTITTLDTPKDADKKMVVTISPATEGWKTWITGTGDDPDPPPGTSGRGLGAPFVLHFTGSGYQMAEFQYNEPVEVHDGQITWKPVENWGADDNFSVGVAIAASVASPTGSGGNCIVVPTGLGYNAIIPYPDGDHYVDLATQASPIPATAHDGYWDVDYNTGTITPSSKPGAAEYHLLDVPVSSWLLRKIPMGNPLGTFDIDAYKTEYLHPRWHLIWEANKTTPSSGSISGWIFVFRRFTT